MAPTIFHVTHWKAGSQWVRALLEAAVPDRVVPRQGSPRWPFDQPIRCGGIYTPVYASYGQFCAGAADIPEPRAFAVIRDPRDTVVSWYFSLLYSHCTYDPTVWEWRQKLRKLDKPAGIALLIGRHLYDVISIQQEWVGSGARVFRYEDLLHDQHEGFRQIFEHCGIDLPQRRRRRIVDHHRFSRQTWWRFGREDVRSHLRKGVAGDWRNHFTDDLKRSFKLHHGQALIRAGYEKDDSW